MNFNVKQQIFNIYKHHNENVMEVICGPSFEMQVDHAKEYIIDVLQVLISNYNYNEIESFLLPEVNLDWLNMSIQKIKKTKIYEKLVIGKSGDEILINIPSRFDADLTDLYEFLSTIYQNGLKRNDFHFRLSSEIKNNQELALKDNAFDALYRGYQMGILSVASIVEAYRSLTFKNDAIINSSVKIFSDYKIFSLAFLSEENVMLIPHIMEDQLLNFMAFDLEYLIFEQKTENSITIKPIYSQKNINDFQSLINTNKQRFKSKTSMSYNHEKRNYVFEIN